MSFELRALLRLRSGNAAAPKRRNARPSAERLEDRLAPAADFLQTNLVSDVPGLAQITDANGVNAWGLTAGPTSPFWVSNQGTGTSTLYNTSSPLPQVVPLVVGIPPNPNDTPLPAHGSPTGDVFNIDPAGGFVVSEGAKSGPSVFLFATTDGNIDGWSPGVDRTHALIGATHAGAVYTGLAIGKDANGDTLLYAADFAHNAIDVYDSNFQPVTTLKGDFTDPNLPAGYRVFNVQAVNNQLYVEYAPFDPATGGVLPGAGNGLVDVYNADGQLRQELIRGGRLNDPWGVALAPANFGAFSDDLLVGNFGGGNINAFNPTTGKFVGELKTAAGKPFEVEHLWALEFGNGSAAGPTNTLFFTAGLTSHFGAGTGTPHGLFGSLQAVPTLQKDAAIVPNLGQPEQIASTVPANGDKGPRGVAIVPQGFTSGGVLSPGDVLVSNFNQGTGSTVLRFTPEGGTSVFFQGQPGLGLTSALGVLRNGFVVVGSMPVSAGTPQAGSLLFLDKSGNLVMTLSDSALLDGPAGLAVNDQGDHAQLFVSNALSGTVTRIDLDLPAGGTPVVESETRIASGFAHMTGANGLPVGPSGLAFDPRDGGTLYVASTADNEIFAIPGAARARTSRGKGQLFISDGAHLHGPVGLALAPDGGLIVSNGDAVNADPAHLNEIVEFDRDGKFVGESQLDAGAGGAAAGIAVTTVNGEVRFAAVDGNTNTLDLWTFVTEDRHHGRRGDGDGDGDDHGGR